MKKALKFFSIIILSFLLLVTIMLVTIILSQNKIVDIALHNVSETLNATIEVDEVNFTLFKKFPYATFEFSGVKLKGKKAETSNSGKDIFYIKRAYVSVKTRPLMDYRFEIVKLEFEGATLQYNLDTLGMSNIDFLLGSDTTSVPDSASTTLPFVDLKEVILRNITLAYQNDSNKTSAHLFIPEITAKANISDEKIRLHTEGSCELKDCNVDSTNLYLMQQLTTNFNLTYEEDTLYLKKLNITSDGAQLSTSGKIAFSNKLYTNLIFTSDGFNLGELIKYAPKEMLDKNGIENVSGLLAFSGSINGFMNDSVLPKISLDYTLSDGKITTKDYPAIQHLAFKGNYNNGLQQNNATTRVEISSMHFATQQSSVNATFTISNLDKPKYTLNTDLNLSLEEFKSFVPDSLAKEISGKFEAKIATRGTVPDSINDAFINYVLNNSTASLKLNNINVKTDSLSVENFSGKLTYKAGIINADGLNVYVPNYEASVQNSSFELLLKGTYLEMDKMELKLNALHVSSPQGNISGTGNIQNLDYPSFDFNLISTIHLEALKPFISDTLVKDISGKIEAQITTSGKIHPDSIADQITPILMERSHLSFMFSDVNATLPDTLMQLKNFYGKVDLAPDTISISETSGNAIGISFRMDSISIVNVYNTLLLNLPEHLSIYGNIGLGELDHAMFDALLAQEEVSNSADSEVLDESLDEEPTNYTVDLKGKFAIESFNLDHSFITKLSNFIALDFETESMLHSYVRDEILVENISTKFNITDSLSILEDFYLKAFGGTVNSFVRYRVRPDSSQTINVRNIVNRMDIKRLLYDCNSFGQDSLITHENIKGLLSTDIYTLLYFYNDSLITENTRVKGNLKLENGGVFNYQPAIDMAKFTGLKELDNIEFKTLESNIFMFKNKMYVPKTNIVSTAMDISAFGMQSLADDYQYHLQLNLGDVLTGKSKKLLERQAKSGDEVNDNDVNRSAIKLIYAEIDGKQKTGFDPKKSRESMKLKILTQEKMLNFLFTPELIKFNSGVR